MIKKICHVSLSQNSALRRSTVDTTAMSCNWGMVKLIQNAMRILRVEENCAFGYNPGVTNSRKKCTRNTNVYKCFDESFLITQV